NWAPAANGIVRALAVTGTNLIVGGSFTRVNGHTNNVLAKLDTSISDAVDPSWNPVTNLSAVVHALAVGGTNVYVGGLNLGIGGESLISPARYRLTTAHPADTAWFLSARPRVAGF